MAPLLSKVDFLRPSTPTRRQTLHIASQCCVGVWRGLEGVATSLASEVFNAKTMEKKIMKLG